MHTYIRLEPPPPLARILVSAPEVGTVIKVMCALSDLLPFLFPSKYICIKDIVLSLCVILVKGYQTIKLYFLIFVQEYISAILRPNT